MKPLEKQSQRWLKKEAWRLFSLYIRKRDLKCFTCDVVKPYKELQGGHFRHGHTKEGFFDERNVHAQCPRCNTYLSGNLSEYGLRLAQNYGLQNMISLKRKWDKDHNWTRKELIQIIKKYYGSQDNGDTQ